MDLRLKAALIALSSVPPEALAARNLVFRIEKGKQK